jgi:hypothetical protein
MIQPRFPVMIPPRPPGEPGPVVRPTPLGGPEYIVIEDDDGKAPGPSAKTPTNGEPNTVERLESPRHRNGPEYIVIEDDDDNDPHFSVTIFTKEPNTVGRPEPSGYPSGPECMVIDEDGDDCSVVIPPTPSGYKPPEGQGGAECIDDDDDFYV